MCCAQSDCLSVYKSAATVTQVVIRAGIPAEGNSSDDYRSHSVSCMHSGLLHRTMV